MCIAANRFKGIRAAICWSLNEARAARNDDDCNVLCLSARYTSLEEAGSIMTAFLSTALRRRTALQPSHKRTRRVTLGEVMAATICPTVLAENLHVFREQMERVEPFAKRVHIDLADGVFAPSKTVGFDHLWWPDGCAADLHVMCRAAA